MDHITKLPKTKRGNTAILSMIDSAPHFVMFFAVRSLNEEDVIYALSQMFGFIGSPAKFLSDNFSTFKANSYRGFCRLIGATPTLAKVNNSNSHGMVERSNQEVLRHLNAFKAEQFEQEWDTLLGLAAHVINDTVSTITGFPPRVLMFGTQHSKDTVHIRTLSEHDKLHNPNTVARYLLSLDFSMARMYEIVHDRIEAIIDERIAKAPNGFSSILTTGDIVLRRRPVKVKDFVRKYVGPFEVVEARGDKVVLKWLATPPKGAHKVVYSHVSELKRYIGPDATHNPDHMSSAASQGSKADVEAEKEALVGDTHL